MPTDSDTQQKFRIVNREYLLSLTDTADFDIYARMSSDRNGQPVLLLKKGASLDTLQSLLSSREGYSVLCIREEDHVRYWRVIEDSLQQMVNDPQTPVKRKASLLYTCARDTMEEVFANPRSGENMDKARTIVEAIIQLAIVDAVAIPHLLKLSAANYRAFTHCINATVFSVGLWLTIGKGEDKDLREMAYGCILHDIGLGEIDPRIINKPAKLTSAEYTIVKRHPRLGYEMLTGLIPDAALDVILHHHEKIDGSGYPEGLTGERISDSVKICSIADVYDALTSRRPYAGTRTPFEALLLMKERMAGHFEQENFLKFIHFLGDHR